MKNNNITFEQAINLYNDYCDKTNTAINKIHTMENFENAMSMFSKFEVANIITNGEFSPRHKYFKLKTDVARPEVLRAYSFNNPMYYCHLDKILP